MRYLVGAACVAVIAFVGYFFWGEMTASRPTAAALSTSSAVSQHRLSVEDDLILYKIAGANLDPYSPTRHPEVYDALHRETIVGELQRLRTFAAIDAARFVACEHVESVHYSPTASTRMDLAVDVVCSSGLGVSYTRNGPITEIRPMPRTQL